jgi:hypothetical protein
MKYSKATLKRYIGLFADMWLFCITLIYLVMIVQVRDQFNLAIFSLLLSLGVIAIALLVKSIRSKHQRGESGSERSQ